MAFTRVPEFLPSQSGFHFSNNWPLGTNYPVVTLPVVGTIAGGDAGNGLCGGFVLAALDLFCHTPRLLPPPNTDSDRPANGSPIFNYITGRLIDSWGDATQGPNANAARVIEWIQTPGHDVTISFYGPGLARRVIELEWPKIKIDIDSGVPSPLSLVMGPERGALDVNGIIDSLHHCHQVLAYAYEVDQADNLTLLVYDCNDPFNDNSTLSLNLSNPAHTTPIAAPAISAALGGVDVRGFFRVVYTLHDPSAIAGPQPSLPLRGWSRLGDGLFNSGPAVASMTPNRLDVFARGTDDRLYTISWTGAAWNAWRQLAPQQISSDPAAVSWGPNRIDVFARGTDNQMYKISWDGSNWTGWSRLGDGLFNSGPAVASMAPNRLDVFARGTDDRLYTISWTGAAWNAWRQLAPEQISSDPAAVSWGPNRIDVFARGTDNQMYKISWDGSNWTGWSRLGDGLFNSGPAVASMTPNRLDVFARGTDDRLYTISWTGAAWNAWRQLAPEQISSDPAAVSWGPNRLDVFARGTDNQMYKISWDGTRW